MYYKILKDNKVIEVTCDLQYVWIPKGTNRLLICSQKNAQGIISLDGKTVWHLKGFYPFPTKDYETVEAIPITKEEYHQWKALNGRTPEEIIDEYTLSLIEGGLL